MFTIERYAKFQFEISKNKYVYPCKSTELDLNPQIPSRRILKFLSFFQYTLVQTSMAEISSSTNEKTENVRVDQKKDSNVCCYKKLTLNIKTHID